MSAIMFGCGVVSLLLIPFTGVTVLTAAAFFVIAWVLNSLDL
jgi:hypothetical protein